MQTLRNAHLITRFVLVWFALFLGVAIASPFVSPASPVPHCAAMEAMKIASGNHDSTGEKSVPNMGCPLCAGICAPPVTVSTAVARVVPQSFEPYCHATACAPLRTTAPPPARGPPTAS
jgi:hypothetical protein